MGALLARRCGVCDASTPRGHCAVVRVCVAVTAVTTTAVIVTVLVVVDPVFCNSGCAALWCCIVAVLAVAVAMAGCCYSCYYDGGQCTAMLQW